MDKQLESKHTHSDATVMLSTVKVKLDHFILLLKKLMYNLIKCL